MSIAVKLSDHLIQEARIQAAALNRSAAGQIEYWSKIGKIAEENPDLTYPFIRDILIGIEEAKAGNVDTYQFG